MFGIKHKGTDTLRSEPSYASRGLAVFKNSEHVVLDAAVEGNNSTCCKIQKCVGNWITPQARLKFLRLLYQSEREGLEIGILSGFRG